MAFVCVPHDLAIAELNAHGFILKALKLINRCFSKKITDNKSVNVTIIDKNFSAWYIMVQSKALLFSA